MNGALGMADLLSRTDLEERQRTFVSKIQQSGANLLTVINDILDFSKIEAGKLELDLRQNFDLRETVEDQMDLLADSAHRKNLEFCVFFCQSTLRPVSYSGDPSRLRQILTNLVVANAIKFTQMKAKSRCRSRIRRVADRTRSDDSVERDRHGDWHRRRRSAPIYLRPSSRRIIPHLAKIWWHRRWGFQIARQLATMMGGDVGLEQRART